MTKQQEIKLLDKTIEKFGMDSYIGQWLANIKPAIVWAIKNDVTIEASVQAGPDWRFQLKA